MRPVYRIFAVTILSCMSACSGLDVLNAITPASGYSRLRDVAFDAGDLRLDVYKPTHARGAPVVVFVYGGSWQKKSTFAKKDYEFMGQALAARGYVTLIPDYRLYPEVQFPAFIDDVAKAVVFAHANAAAYGGDPDRLVLMGHSAGAYNAAMVALDSGYMQRAGGDRKWIRAMIGLAGAYDFLPLTDPKLKQVFASSEPLSASQPINHVDGTNPPMLLIAGVNDDIVYVKNTNNLYDRIKSRNGVVEKVVYPKMGHIKILITNASRLQLASNVMNHVVDFIQRYAGPAADAH